MIGSVRQRLEICSLHSLPLDEYLASLGCLTKEEAREIISIGAAYINMNRVGSKPFLNKGDTTRVHLDPRRFSVGKIDWKSHILQESEDWVALNKPHGIPVHPTCDNQVENVLHQMKTALKCELWITHRLDWETGGILVLAKTRAFASSLCKQFRERTVEKEYTCFTSAAVVPGMYKQFIRTEGFAPYESRWEEFEDSKECELEILSCEKWDEAYKVICSPKTGRHHQIRSQLASLGAPILDDDLYSVRPTFVQPGASKISLWCTGLVFRDGAGNSVKLSFQPNLRT